MTLTVRIRLDPLMKVNCANEEEIVTALHPCPSTPFPYLKGMEVHFTPETEEKLKNLSAQSGRDMDELVEDALADMLTNCFSCGRRSTGAMTT